MLLKTLPFLLSSVLLNCGAQLFIRKGMLCLGELPKESSKLIGYCISACFNIYLILGMLSYAVSILLWMYVLSKVEVSVAYPFQSLGYVVAAFLAFYIFAEPLGAMKLTGIVIICIGVFVLSLSTK